MPHYARWERAPHYPYECVICTHEANAENFLVDVFRDVEDYGAVYICKSCIHSLASFVGIIADVESVLQSRINELNTELSKVPSLIERLVNGIRDLSISTSADLLAISTPTVLVDDKKSEQGDSSVDADKFGDDSTVEPSSEPAVDQGPDSISASPSRKRTANTSTRTSSASNG
jgi:hypothetical protein